jgi:chromosome segregation ATPase
MLEKQLGDSVMMDLKVEVAMLKKEVGFINKLFERVDVVINKIDSQHDLLIDKTSKIDSNLSFTKEELTNLCSSLEKTEKELAERILSIERLLSDEIKTINTELTSRLDKQEELTGNLTNLKMMVIGIVAFIGWIATNFDFIKKLFH